MPASIVDFDLTLTKEHTFPTCHINAIPPEIKEDANSLIAFGAAHASTNLRDGVKNHLVLSLEEDNIFAVATHHNNPHFVAGYMQEMLGRRIKPKLGAEGIKQICEGARIGIKSYSVDGSDKLMLIAYIPEKGDAFRACRNILQGKNEMISALIAVWQSLGFWPQKVVDFYDDDEVNIDFARNFLPPEIGKIFVHQINVDAPAFVELSSVASE